MYLQWIKLRLPSHPLNRRNASFTKFIVQKIRGSQGTRDAGHEGYKLLALIFTKVLGMIGCTPKKGLYYWSKGPNHAYISLATDDIHMASTDISLYDLLCSKIDKYFDYTTTT